jgi:hypothetical protein
MIGKRWPSLVRVRFGKVCGVVEMRRRREDEGCALTSIQ